MKLNFKLKFKDTKRHAFTLVEVVVVVGLFAIIASSMSIFSLDSFRVNQNIKQKNMALSYFQESLEALQLSKSASWSTIIQNTNAGARHVTYSSNQYQIVSGNDLKNGVTIGFTITYVNRDSSGSIVTTGGTQDVHTRAVNLTASWTNLTGQNYTMNSTAYINDWHTNKLTQTTQAEFDGGTKNLTVTTSVNGGEVQMENIGYPDWCKPKVIGNPLDIAGSGVASAVNAEPFKAFVGTQNTTNGTSFSKINLSDTHPPSAAVAGTLGNQKINRIWGEGNYIYVSSDDDAQEVKIFDVSTNPYTQVGYFNAPGTANGLGVFSLNNKGYVTTVDNKLYVFDLSAKTGSRTQLGVKTLMGQGSQVKVVGNYAYISLTNGSHVELQEVDISNPANMPTVGTGNTSQSDASDIFVNSDGSRAYVGTAASATEKEFIIFDTSSLPTAQSQQYYQESGGQVTIEAENYDSILSRGGKSWTPQTNITGYSGTGYMFAGPDTGTSITTADYFKTSPELGYKVNFATTGTYYFWVRGYATSTNDNNINGGYDGANYPSAQNLSTTSYNQWKWFRGSIDIPTAEMHWINLWMGDDGFKVDKIMLTTNSSYTPTGTGLAQSTRTTGTITMPSINRQIGDYDTAGMSINGITVVENNTRAILVGSGGQQYQVLDLTNESSLTKCGGLTMTYDINAVASVKEPDSDSYSYLLTKDPNKEFQIIRGGPGGSGGALGEEYATTADFTSSVLDSGAATTTYLSTDWSATVPTNSNIKLQVRCGTTTDLSAQTWLGPDGTNTTYFTDPNSSYISLACQNKRYIQYKIFFTSDTTVTPIFNSININYQT